MPVIGRIDWAIRQLDMGRKVRITFGESLGGDKLKVIIFLDPPISHCASEVTKGPLRDLLRSARQKTVEHSSTDRGHKHTNGLSVM